MRLKITKFGESAEGIQLSGNPKSCEPEHVRIAFPGGDVEVVRATDGANPDYWVHVRVTTPKGGMYVKGEDVTATISDARLDIHGRNASEVNHGEFSNPNLYHLAVRVKPDWDI